MIKEVPMPFETHRQNGLIWLSAQIGRAHV